jgi:hypothetical protein
MEPYLESGGTKKPIDALAFKIISFSSYNYIYIYETITLPIVLYEYKVGLSH